MLGNSWAIALLICTAASFFLVILATVTAVKILLFWDADSDSEYQIQLEGRTWLAAALIESGLAVQVLSLVLLVFAATDFSDMIAGAMCATGSFLANEYGTKSLYVKIAGLFLYGFWIVLNRLDLRSEYTPLIRIKFIYLLFLLPYLTFDGYYLISYLYNLEPDIITSCCGVIFSDKELKTNFLMLQISSEIVVGTFYTVATISAVLGWILGRWLTSGRVLHPGWMLFYGCFMLAYFLLALVAITIFFSSYIYAMPYHNCPFDILHREFNFIGIPIYLSLFGAAFLGISSAAAAPLWKMRGLAAPLSKYQRFALNRSSWLILVHLLLVTYPVLRYLFFGGEV